MQQFNPIKTEDWLQIIPGRVGRLSLRGALGCLDIFVSYFATGSQGAKERTTAMNKIAETVQPRHKVLTIMMGD